MNRIAVIAVAAGLLGTSACALMVRGTTEEITVTSDPPGATATLDNGEAKVTPFSITVPRNQDLHFHFTKPGYEPIDVSDNTDVSGGYLLPDILTSGIGVGIDGATGAYYAHQQSAVNVHLYPAAAAAEAKPVAQSASQPAKPPPPLTEEICAECAAIQRQQGSNRP